MGRPETGKYEGPREQQADGSLSAPGTVPPTKAPPRPAPPVVTKTETRPAAPVVTSPEPKAISPSVSAATRPAMPSAVNRSATTHTVEADQTYYSISKLYGITVDELLALNSLTTNDKLEIGQKLALKLTPGGRLVQPSTGKPTTASEPPAAVTYHTVAKGETMFRISQIYGVSIEQIQEWNSLTDTGVKMGQKIKIMKP